MPTKIPFTLSGHEYDSHDWRAKPEPGYLLVSRCQACGMIGYKHYRLNPENPDHGSDIWHNDEAYEKHCPNRPRPAPRY